MLALSRAIAVDDFDPVIGATQALGHFFGNHHRAVLAPGATERNRQVALAFADVVRDEIDQQRRNPRDKFAGLREGADVFGDTLVAPRQWPEFRHKVRIRQETHIKDQVRILGNALTEPEAHARNQQALLSRLFLETLRDERAKLMNIELRSIDDKVGELTDRAEMPPLRFESGFHRG